MEKSVGWKWYPIGYNCERRTSSFWHSVSAWAFQGQGLTFSSTTLPMARFGQAFAVSMGALIGGAFGFYLLEDYKIKAKVRDKSIPYFNRSFVVSIGATIGLVVGKETRIRTATAARKHIDDPCAPYYPYRIQPFVTPLYPPFTYTSAYIHLLHRHHHHYHPIVYSFDLLYRKYIDEYKVSVYQHWLYTTIDRAYNELSYASQSQKDMH